FPYEQLVHHGRSSGEPELELVDTGVLDGGFFDVTVDYARAAADDLCILVRIRNAGPAARLHVLPTLWFRNTWRDGGERPRLEAADGAIVGELCLTGDGAPEPLFCENEDGAKEAIGNALLYGAPT